MLRVCVLLHCLQDSKRFWKLNVKNQGRPKAHHRKEEQDPDSPANTYNHSDKGL